MTDQPHEQSGSCRREFYRLRYPVTSRPLLSIGGRDFEVSEISERGLRIHDIARHPRLQVNSACPDLIEGKLRLRSTTLSISGFLVRRDGDELVVVEVDGITFQAVLEEQRRLASAFLTPAPSPIDPTSTQSPSHET